MAKILINIRITPEEHEILKKTAAKAGRTKTDILRELIRSLESGKRGKR
jgi:predicted DNA-binding protein